MEADFAVLEFSKMEPFKAEKSDNLGTEFVSLSAIPEESIQENLYVLSTIPGKVELRKAKSFHLNGNFWNYYASNEVGMSGSPVLSCTNPQKFECDFKKLMVMHIQAVAGRMMGIPGMTIVNWLKGTKQ
jgi:hypothetical protein